MFRSLGAASVLLLLAIPAPAQSQTSAPSQSPADRWWAGESPTITETEARLDSLLPLLDAARRAEEIRRERDMMLSRVAAAAVTRTDTFRVGPMTVITPVARSESARALIEELWASDFHEVDRSPELEKSVFIYQWGTPRLPVHAESARFMVQLRAYVSLPRVIAAVHDGIATAINKDLIESDAQVGDWINGNPLRHHDLGRVYRMLATTRSRATRSCMEGNAGACGSAMGLGIRLDDEVEREWRVPHFSEVLEWYTPAERRLIVRGTRGFQATTPSSVARWRKCVETRDQSACDEAMANAYSDHTPLNGTVRASFVAFALDRGGAGAWGRLTEEPTMTPGEAIEHAAQTPLAELLADWRAEVISSRPVTYAGLGQTTLFTTLWILAISFLALRSTRWRLG